MHGLITLVNDNQVDNYLKEILEFVYYGSFVNNRPKTAGAHMNHVTRKWVSECMLIVKPIVYYLLCWGLTTRQPLWVILCRLPEKGRKEIEEIVEEMKERNREERGTGMKGKKQKK